MLHFERIDVSELIHVNKTSESKERDIFHYSYFLALKCLSFNQMPAINAMIY